MTKVPGGAGMELLGIIHRYLDGEIDANTFKTGYSVAWRRWRDSDELYRLNEQSSGTFDRAFTAADCYLPEGEYSNDWDIGENKLKLEISAIAEEISRIDV